MEYVVHGTVIKIRSGVEIQHGPGDMVIATKDVSHWRETALAARTKWHEVGAIEIPAAERQTGRVLFPILLPVSRP